MFFLKFVWGGMDSRSVEENLLRRIAELSSAINSSASSGQQKNFRKKRPQTKNKVYVRSTDPPAPALQAARIEVESSPSVGFSSRNRSGSKVYIREKRRKSMVYVRPKEVRPSPMASAQKKKKIVKILRKKRKRSSSATNETNRVSVFLGNEGLAYRKMRKNVLALTEKTANKTLKVPKEKLPKEKLICTFFLRGECFRDECPYSHVYYGDACDEFLKNGTCGLGDKCTKHHVMERKKSKSDKKRKKEEEEREEYDIML